MVTSFSILVIAQKLQREKTKFVLLSSQLSWRTRAGTLARYVGKLSRCSTLFKHYVLTTSTTAFNWTMNFTVTASEQFKTGRVMRPLFEPLGKSSWRSRCSFEMPILGQLGNVEALTADTNRKKGWVSFGSHHLLSHLDMGCDLNSAPFISRNQMLNFVQRWNESVGAIYA